MADEVDIYKAAAILGRKGGKTTYLSFGHSYYQALGKKASAARWANHVKKSKLVEKVVKVNEDQVVNVSPS
jgi:hypothetical protein